MKRIVMLTVVILLSSAVMLVADPAPRSQVSFSTDTPAATSGAGKSAMHSANENARSGLERAAANESAIQISQKEKVSEDVGDKDATSSK